MILPGALSASPPTSPEVVLSIPPLIPFPSYPPLSSMRVTLKSHRSLSSSFTFEIISAILSSTSIHDLHFSLSIITQCILGSVPHTSPTHKPLPKVTSDFENNESRASTQFPPSKDFSCFWPSWFPLINLLFSPLPSLKITLSKALLLWKSLSVLLFPHICWMSVSPRDLSPSQTTHSLSWMSPRQLRQTLTKNKFIIFPFHILCWWFLLIYLP